MKISPINLNTFYKPKQNFKPIAFKGFDCPEDSFEIKRIYRLPCPACSNPMIQQNQIDNFVAGCQNAVGDELTNLFSKYRVFFHETELKVADILTYQSTKNPKMDILQLAQKYIEDKTSEMANEQLAMLSQLSIITKSIPSSQRASLESLIDRYIYRVNHEKDKFSKEELEKEVISILSSNPSVIRKAQKTIRKTPTINDPEMKFLLKYGTKSKAELAAKLLTPALATCEHVKPKSSGGKNNTENYLAECMDCNSRRNDTPFAKWITSLPNFQESFRKYITIIAGKIESGEISGEYIDYPSDIAETISKETNGRIMVKPPRIELSIDAVKLNAEAKIKQLKKSISDMRAELDEARKLQVKANNSEQFQLYLEYTILSKDKTNLSNQRQSLLEAKNKLQSLINGYYSSVVSMKELQGSDMASLSHKEELKRKSKILSLKRHIDAITIEDKEAELANTEVKLSQVNQRLSEINKRLEELRPNIHFSSDYQKQITDVKVQIFELNQLYERVKDRNGVAQLKQQKILEAKELEQRIAQLVEENNKLTPVDDGTNLSEFNKMNYLIKRADELKDKLQKTMGKDYLEVDSIIFEFAKQMASEKIQQLTASSKSVQYSINLSEISDASKQLNALHAQIEQLGAKEREFELVQAKIDSMKTMEELNQELAKLNALYAAAKEIEAAVDIEQKIKTLEEEIARKSEILEKIENKELTEEEFIRIISEV